jgi:hypothetical protein
MFHWIIGWALFFAGLLIGLLWVSGSWPQIRQGDFKGSVTLAGQRVPGWICLPLLVLGWLIA